MAKETMKEKIARLEQEVEKQREQINTLLQKIYRMQNESDNEFANSPYFKQLKNDLAFYKQCEVLYEKCEKKRAKEHDDNVKLREEIQKLKSESGKVHNERGAGRKPTITLKEKKAIINDRANNMTFKQLSEKYGYSVGAIHKLISEYTEQEEILE